MHDDDNNDELVKVTGVINEVPSNTHLKFDDAVFVQNPASLRNGKRPGYALNRFEQTWDRNDMYTFVQVLPGTMPAELEAKFPALVQAQQS